MPGSETHPFIWQLAGGGYVLDLRPPPQPPDPPRPDQLAQPAEPCVLLVTRTADAELDHVGRLLRAAGVPVTRLNSDAGAPAGPAGPGGLVIDLDRRAVRIAGRWISPTVTWLRHFSVRSMPGGRGALGRAFAADSWQALADQLGTVSAAMVNPRDPGLLTSLTVAKSLRIATPATVVSTDPAAAKDLLGSDRVIIKALHQHFVEAAPGLLSGVFPEIIDRAALDQPGRTARTGRGGSPVVIQEYVDHDAETRVYFVHGVIAAAFAISKSGPAQPWLSPDDVTATAIDPPPAITAATVALAGALSLSYGAFDFLSVAGVPVFLEVNVTGDWRWLEARTGTTPVTMAVAAMLGKLHRASGASGARGGPGTGSRVGLLSFLSGGLPAGSDPVDPGPG